MLSILVALVPVFAAVAPARRPGDLDAYSSSFVSAAVEARRTGVSPNEASSVASVMFSRGVEPKQVTEMMQMGDRLLMNTKSINAVSLSELANVLASAYTSMHTQPQYSDFVKYVKAHSSIYDISKLAVSGTAMRAGAENRRALLSIYGSLIENSNGRHALETFSEVLESYMKDFGVQQSRGGILSLADLVYNLI